jgi:hypothetical protein
MAASIASETYLALGEMIVRYNRVESTMKSFIAVLVDHKDFRVDHAITAGMPFKGLQRLLMSLYRYRQTDPNAVGELGQLLNRIGDLETRRNELIHSNWTFNPELSKAYRSDVKAKFATGLNIINEEYDIEQVKALSKDLQNVGKELGTIETDWLMDHPTEQFKALVDLLIRKKVQ